MTVDTDHNKPPEMLELIRGVTTGISEWMADNPVIQDHKTAQDAKMQLDRGKFGLKDLDVERDSKVRPLNDQVGVINGQYKRPKQLLSDVLDELTGRINAFLKQEKMRLEEEARKAREALALAERIAREAEAAEQEKLSNADAGEIGIKPAEVLAEADEAFDQYKLARRQAAIADKATNVKVSGGLGRAIGLRTREELKIADAAKVIAAIGLPDGVRQAILIAAKAYKRLNGSYPPGIEVTIEQQL